MQNCVFFSNIVLVYEFVGLCIGRNTGSGGAEPPQPKQIITFLYIFQNCVIHSFGRILNSLAILLFTISIEIQSYLCFMKIQLQWQHCWRRENSFSFMIGLSDAPLQWLSGTIKLHVNKALWICIM